MPDTADKPKREEQPTKPGLNRAARAELIWEGKYDDKGQRVAPLRVALPFQTVETINESNQERQRGFLFESPSAYHAQEWRNRLIWGDKKYVLPSLLDEFSGKVNLIYIDPPFDTGADFSFTATVPDDPDMREDDSITFTKEPSIIEQKAYRDTWGRGLDSYLQWFYEGATLLHNLLHETGSAYVHLDWRLIDYVRIVMDEIFGSDCYQGCIRWKRQTSSGYKGLKKFGRAHDSILWYSKTPNFLFNPQYIPYSESYIKSHYNRVDDQGRRYREHWLGTTTDETIQEYLKSGRVVKRSNGKYEKRLYLDDQPGTPVDDVWTDIFPVNSQAHEDTKYPTQKPEALLDRIIKTSSNEGDLVLDCFVGSGTTAAVAERLKRRWIACDLGRFAIHTTRKRLLSNSDVRPFIVQNLGKYERQMWAGAQFGEANGNKAAARQRAYTEFILKLYQAMPLHGYTWLHGVRGGRMVHVGAVDAPISIGDVSQIAAEFKRAIGTGKDAPKTNGVDILGWDFAFELNEVAKQQAAAANIQVRFIRIPHDTMDKRAAQQGDVKFFELAALSVETKTQKRNILLRLKDFVIPPDDVPQDVSRAVKHWSQWIDYWAVDWDNKGDTFHNEWQTYRARKDNKLELETAHAYAEAGEYKIVVKVIDILGNDTTKTVTVKVG